MVDKKIVAQRKRVYGSNFKDIADKFSKRLCIKVTSCDVAELMALMKDARIEAIEKKMEVLENANTVDKKQILELDISLLDSRTDRDNYRWIAQNYPEYKEL